MKTKNVFLKSIQYIRSEVETLSITFPFGYAVQTTETVFIPLRELRQQAPADLR